MLKHRHTRFEVKEGESTRFRVVSRENPSLKVIYNNVRNVDRGFDDNGNLCFQIQEFNGDEATFPICEWRIQHETFIDI